MVCFSGRGPRIARFSRLALAVALRAREAIQYCDFVRPSLRPGKGEKSKDLAPAKAALQDLAAAIRRAVVIAAPAPAADRICFCDPKLDESLWKVAIEQLRGM